MLAVWRGLAECVHVFLSDDGILADSVFDIVSAWVRVLEVNPSAGTDLYSHCHERVDGVLSDLTTIDSKLIHSMLPLGCLVND